MRRRWIGALASLVLGATGVAIPGTVAAAATATPTTTATASSQTSLVVKEASQSSSTNPEKIDVMGIWAHPDDDAGLTTPCGVWHDLYGTRCGIILATRGEGGSNSVGSEAGPDLGLRRENEDRNSHVRSGTTDIFYLDRVDFFYNTSAPLTEKAWDADETLRRTVRIIRETQPEVLVTWTASLAAGHGNHQEAGRLTWEAAAAAADPTKFPEQLTGPDAVSTWQVRRILESPHTAGTGAGSGENCMASFVSDPTNPYPVVGTWTGYDAHDTNVEGKPAFTWAPGSSPVSGVADGTVKSWAQVGREGARAHATQARTMQKTPYDPTCQRWSMPWSVAPIHEAGDSDAGRDDTLLLGATKDDTGGFPAGSLFYGTADTYRLGRGESTKVTVHMSSGKGMLPAGEVALTAPDGWTVSEPQKVSGITGKDSTLTFTVTAADDAALEVSHVGIRYTSDDGRTTAYNQTYFQGVPAVQGTFQRWGNFAEYESWMERTGAYSGGLSEATDRIGAGESISVPVVVTNRSSEPASGTATLSTQDGAFSLKEASLPFTDVAPGESTTLTFTVTHTDPRDAGSRTVPFTLNTVSGSSTSEETLTMYVVPSTVIPQLSAAPKVDGDVSGDEYGTKLDLSTRWEGADCESTTDCGEGSQAGVGWYGDSLYSWVKVTDDRASAAATPDRCFGHWLVDSTELLIDPSGRSDDTSTTFKLGVFPFTDDATGTNGNGVNGPCWERDADNHQGFSTGPLADTVTNGRNAEGVEVAAHAVRDADGTYTEGSWIVEVRIPFADLPATIAGTSAAPTGDLATNTVDPDYVGFNITPYDSDNQDFIGDTRLAWSAFGSVQSEPYRWGHAYLEGYRGPGVSESNIVTGIIGDVDEPTIPQTALQGTSSPETIYQSAVHGTTIAGLQPGDGVTIDPKDVTITPSSVTIKVSGYAGTINAYLWKGDPRFTPVWTSSCSFAEGQIDYGFDACSTSDGKARPWQPDMSGHLLGTASGKVSDGTVTIPITQAVYDSLVSEATMPTASSNGFGPRLLISYRSKTEPYGAEGGVDAWSMPIVVAASESTPEPSPTATPTKPGNGYGRDKGHSGKGSSGKENPGRGHQTPKPGKGPKSGH